MNEGILPKDWIFTPPFFDIINRGKIGLEIVQVFQVSFITRSQFR